MGRPKAARLCVLTASQLNYLEDWCNGLIANAGFNGNDDPSMALRCVVVRTLIRQARFGTGLATINAQTKAQRSAAAKKAANARWARVRARKAAERGDSCDSA